MTARILYTDEAVKPATNITTSWAPVAGDLAALDLGPARFLRTDEASWSMSFDAVALGAAAVVIVIEPIDLGTGGAINTAAKGANVPAAFPEDGAGNLRLRPGRNALALVGLQNAGADSAELVLTFSGGNVAWDIHAIAPLAEWQMPEGVDADWSISYIDLSAVNVADSGAPSVARRPVLRELNFRLRNRFEDEIILPAEAGLMRILRGAGRSRPLMVIPRDLGDLIDAEAAAFGLIQNDAEIAHNTGPLFSTGEIRIREFI